jgi:hypothetical protein
MTLFIYSRALFIRPHECSEGEQLALWCGSVLKD